MACRINREVSCGASPHKLPHNNAVGHLPPQSFKGSQERNVAVGDNMMRFGGEGARGDTLPGFSDRVGLPWSTLDGGARGRELQ